MRPTKLILIEGIPGSGKSSTAQFLAWQLEQQGVPHRWWYEEAAGHPVALFRDRASLRRVVDDLAAGQHRAVVAAALEQWRRFAAGVERSPEVVLVDSCLYGYLTWSLFPLDVPEDEIGAYVRAVEAILRPIAPCLLYFRQTDVAAALRRICERRGAGTEERFIQHATESAYARRRGLRGFAGMAAYWRDYRDLTDRLFAGCPFPKLTIDDAAADWPAAYDHVLSFLDLPAAPETAVPAEQLARFVGVFRAPDDAARRCTVRLEDGRLLADGLREVWPRTPLLPRGPLTFAVASLPIQVAFREDAAGAVVGLRVSGPPLLGGEVAATYVKE